MVSQLAGSVSAAGKLGLKLRGRAVSALPHGRYVVTVTDGSSAAGFIVQPGGKAATTLTTLGYKGRHSVVLGHPDARASGSTSRKPGAKKTVLRRQLSSATAAAWIAALVARNDFPGAVADPSNAEQCPPASSTMSCTAA